jgi:hypothetical protein
LTTTFQVAFDRLIAFVKRAYCAAPSIVRLGSFSAARHAADVGCLSDDSMIPKKSRSRWGSAGTRSGWCVSGLSQTWLALALAERNERSSRKNTSRLRPQRNER